MRFHLPALLGQPIQKKNSHCAYTAKIVKFAKMMRERGHEVILYGPSGGTDAPCTEYVATYVDWKQGITWDPEDYAESNLRTAAALQARKQPGDFLLLIAGRCQKLLADNHPDLMAVEWGVGYSGTFADYRVFESYAWMHSVYGAHAGQGGEEVMSARGQAYDCVIPNFFDPQDFRLDRPGGESGEPYMLYLGRVNQLKGVEIAEDVAERTGQRLIIAGNEGDYQPRSVGEVIGPVGPEARRDLLAEASCVLVPTLYLEPFGGVAVEAMMSGKPAITTDWGAFTETVQHSRTGWRCRTLGEFCWAAEHACDLDPHTIQDYATENFGLETIAARYEVYFEQLQTLRGEGWYAEWEGLSRTHRYGQVIPGPSSPSRLD